MTNKTKVFGLVAFAVFALVLVAAFASAEFNITDFTVSESEVFGDEGTFRISFNYDNVNNATSVLITSVSSGDSKPFDIVSKQVNLSAGVNNIPIDVTFPFVDSNGNIKGSLNAEVDNGVKEKINGSDFNVRVIAPFCDAGEKGGNLTITDVDINNLDGDDTEWELLDEIEISVDIENDGNVDVDDVQVEIAIFDSGWNDLTDDFDIDEDKMDAGNLDTDEKETVTFSFKVPANVDEDSNYHVMVKTYSDDLGEEQECTESDGDRRFQNVGVKRQGEEENYITFDNIVLTPEQATCGERVSLEFDVFNVGDGGEQDRVKVNLINTELGINQFVEVRNLDEGDDQNVLFDFVLPNNAEEKIYQLRLSSDYEFDNGNYEQSSGEDTLVPLEIFDCGPSVPERVADINVQLVSTEVIPGGELIVRATITNLGDKRTSFAVSATGYQSWAELDNVSPPIVDLDAGQSTDVTLTFVVGEDAGGAESFFVEVRTTEGVENREVIVNVKEGGAQDNGGGFDFSGNSTLWIIGIVNVILIVLIIIVAVRVSRR